MKSISLFFRLSVVMILISNTSFSSTDIRRGPKNSPSGNNSFDPFILSPISFIVMRETELTDFVGICEDGSIILTWNAVPENANSHFIIEQSNNAVNWTTVGVINGGVTSSNLLTYSFIDTQVYDGISYYRLKQTEANGDFKYSKIIDIYSCQVLNQNDFAIYPNPSNGLFNLLSYFDENLLESIEIFTAYGKNAYSTHTFEPLIDLTTKPEGVYFIHFNLKTTKIIKKIIIQH